MLRFLSGHIFSKFRGAYPKRMLRTDHQYNLQSKTSMQAVQRVKTTQHMQQDGSARRKQVVEVQGRSSSGEWGSQQVARDGQQCFTDLDTHTHLHIHHHLTCIMTLPDAPQPCYS